MLRVRHFPKWLDSRLPVFATGTQYHRTVCWFFFMGMQLMADSSGGGKN